MPRVIYKTADGKRVPSVTTMKPDCGALLYWANQQGLNGISLEEARQATATPGSMTHERVDAYIKNKAWTAETWRDKFDTEELYAIAVKRSAQAFDNFAKWHSMTNFKLVSGEVSLVSEHYKFGGTLDAVMIEDSLCLADWKTGASGAIYTDFLYQLGGYAILWEENFPDKPLDGGFHIIRFNRESADFAHWHFSELDDAKKGFLLRREDYEINKRLKKRVS